MTNNDDNLPNPPVRRDRALPLFIVDAAYLLCVFGWTMGLSALGRDYAFSIHPERAFLYSLLVRIFGGWAYGYHLVNLALLYGCMALILLMSRRITRGPWWLGSVAAVWFMANPVKTEAVLHLSGIQELWPGFAGLFFLWTYMRCRDSRGWTAWCAPVLVYLLAALTAPPSISFAFLIPVYEAVYYRDRIWRDKRWIPAVVLGLAAFLGSGQWAQPGAWHPMRMFAPLYMCLYPLGMRPENVALFREHPMLLYGSAVMAVGIGLWLARKVNHPAFTFGLLGAAALRLGQGHVGLDPVTLTGGGRLLPCAALLALAAAGLTHALLRHPHWHKAAVRLTTAACLLAMCTQGIANTHWMHAGRAVRRFQESARICATAHPNRPLAIIPDIRYYHSAPMMLSDAIRYQTPFSSAIPAAPLAPLSFIGPMKMDVVASQVDRWEISFSNGAAALQNQPLLFSWNWWRRYQTERPRETISVTLPDRLHNAVRISQCP